MRLFNAWPLLHERSMQIGILKAGLGWSAFGRQDAGDLGTASPRLFAADAEAVGGDQKKS